MVKQHNNINPFLYYGIPYLTLFAIILFFAKDYLYETLFTSLNITTQNNYEYELNLLLLALWSYLSFNFIRNKRYKLLTDRYYPKDHKHFHKSYQELISFFTKNDPYKMDIESLPIEDWNNADGIILCKYKDKSGQYRLVKRESSANGNLVSFGLPGSGKSTTQASTSAIRFNSTLKKGGCGVFAISIKGDLLNFVRNKRTNIKVFTPDKEEGSYHYNPLEGVMQMNKTERRSFVENMSIIICHDEVGENAAFFVNGSRDYFCSITLYLLYLHDLGELPNELTFPEIVDFILSEDVFNLTMKIKNSPCKIAGEYTNSYEGNSEKNVSGIYNHLCKSIRPFNTGALKVLFDGKGKCITPEDLNFGDIYIDVPQDKYLIYAPAMSIIISNFLMAFMRRDDVSSNQKIVPIMFLLDEAVQLNLDFSILSQAMSTLRSKKVSLFLLMQSIAQLEGRYGEAHAREIIDLCAYISVFNAQDPKSRKFFQELVGRRKMLKRTTTHSRTPNKNSSSSLNVTEVEEFIFEAADFGDLNIQNKKTGIKTYRVMVYANGKYIIGETTPCYE